MILPVQAALERVPANLVEASADLGASPGQTFRNVIFPLALPGIVAGSIFTFSLTLGDYIIPQIIGTSRLFIGQAVYAHQGTAGNIPLAAAFTVVPIVIMGDLSLRSPSAWGRSMRSDRQQSAPLGLKLAAAAGLLFLHLPLLLIFVYAFTTEEKSYQLPAARPDHCTGSPSPGTGRTSGRRCRCRVRVAAISTLIALVLGTLCAAAVSRLALLRPRGDLAAGHPADRAARHHHRHLAALGLRARRHPVLVLDHRARPRDLLRRRRLQQRRGAASAAPPAR